MIEEIGAADLEVFLIRTLSPKERKFSLGKVRLTMSPVATFKWVSGDILVRRSPRVRNGFECTTVPISELALRRGNLMDPPFRYNRVTIQRDCTGSGDCAGGKAKPTLVGTRFTYYADFAGGRSLEVVLQEDLPYQNEYWYKHLVMSLVPGFKCCITNSNKLETISASGIAAFVVLSNGEDFQVKSFCPRDIIWGLGKTGYSDMTWPRFSLARPLTYCWTNEAFDFRVVADEVAESTSSQVADSEVAIDRALRYLVGRMLETRQAISDLIVDLMLDVAAELGTTHPTLDRLRHLRVQITELHEIRRTHRLQPSLLEKLVEFDLKLVLPVFESDLQRLVTDMGTDFGSRIQQRFESMVSIVGVQYMGGFWPNFLNRAAQSIQLKVRQLINQNTDSTSDKSDTSNFNPQRHWSMKNELTYTQALAPPEIDGYQAVLFQSLRTSEASLAWGFASEMAKVKAILSKANGYALRKQQLVCWHWIKNYNIRGYEFYKPPTTLTFIDLGKLEELYRLPRGEIVEDQWVRQLEVNLKLDDPTCVYLEGGTLHVLDVQEEEEGLVPYLHSIKLTPEIEHRKVELSKQITGLDSLWSNDPTRKNPYQRCLSYSAEFGLLFLAMFSAVIPQDFYEFELRLSASAIQRVGSESLVALTEFRDMGFRREINIPWQFNTCDRYYQEVTPNTYGMPFSPLRWCITRRNAYCLWLLSPHSHIIFGFQNHRFVQLSRKLSYRSLCLNIPYVLPVFATDRVNGMIGLFKAKRTWDSKADCWMVTVYKLRLEQY